MNVEKNEIWFKYDVSTKKFTNIIFQENEFSVDIDARISDELYSTFRFILDYSKSTDANQQEINKLTNFMIAKLGHPQKNLNNITEQKTDLDAPVTLRKVAYDEVKKTLEEKHEVNLDGLTDKIVELGCYGINSSRDSIRSSVSAVLSALRNSFSSLGVESWNEPIWRGKKTGRNPHIKVPENFIMPSYASLWENYKIFLDKR